MLLQAPGPAGMVSVSRMTPFFTINLYRRFLGALSMPI